MPRNPITFDRFIRGILAIAGIALVIYLINFLSGVLLPFAVAMLLAYLTFPLVKFLQYKCHLKNRLICIFIALVLVIASVAGFCWLLIPPMVEQGEHLNAIVQSYLHHRIQATDLAGQVESWFQGVWADGSAQQWLKDANVLGVARMAFPKLLHAMTSTLGLLMGVFSGFMTILYWVFILVDYEKITSGWIQFIPTRFQERIQMICGDVEDGMRRYFKIQSLIAAIVGVLFAIGFTIIDLPMAIGLGLFIGVLNLVPYLQTLGLVPAVMLAMLRAVESGQSIWLALLGVAIVFIVVQGIQDAILTPRLMGRKFGLNPAVMLLSLSIWGALLGFIGLIIALPLTTIVISYYKRYVLQKPIVETPKPQVAVVTPEQRLKEYETRIRKGLEKTYQQQVTKMQKQVSRLVPQKNIVRFAKAVVKQPSDLLYEMFDFEKEEDIDNYINLCSMLGLRIRKTVIAETMRRLDEDWKDSTLFIEKVAHYHANYQPGKPISEDINFDFEIKDDEEDDDDIYPIEADSASEEISKENNTDSSQTEESEPAKGE